MSLKLSLISAAVLITGSLLFYGCFLHPAYRFAHSSPEKKAKMIVDRISKELDLSDAQKDKLNQIKDEILAKHKSKANKFEDMFNFLQTELKKDKMDENLLKEKVNEFHSDREEMQSFMISKLVEFHDMLTPAQRETLAKKMTELKNKFHSND